MASPAPPRVIRFGLFELDVSAGQLRKQNRTIKLQDQPVQVLQLLVSRPGDIVSRDEIQRALWPADTFVEFDQGLNTAIKKLRVALGDSADNPRFIETVPRKGYRFIAPVGVVETAVPSDTADKFSDAIANRRPSDTAALEVAAAPVPRRGITRWRRMSVTGLIICIAGLLVWILQRKVEPDRGAYNPIPLTTDPGTEINPTFSPDGAQVAFTGRPPSRGHADIYVKLTGANEALRLTNASDGSFCPAWSPDGRSIAFLRHSSVGRLAVFLIPPIGGPERKVTEVEAIGSAPCIAWDPTGKWLVLPDRDSPEHARGLFAVSVDNGEKRRLTSAPPASGSDADPAISPGGDALVFRRNAELFLLELSQGLEPKGEPRRITFENNHSASPAWMPDGRAIVACLGAPHSPALYKIALSWPGWRPGKPQLLAFAGQGVRTPAISRQGRLAYAIFLIEANIWRLDLTGGAGMPATRLIASTRLDHTPQYSPSGKQIAFASNRSGTHEIWICDADGSNARKLTAIGGPYTADPRWSPDGQELLFQTYTGKWHSWIISAEGGQPRSLQLGDLGPTSWSHDGKWLYLSGKGQIWKVLSRGGPTVQVTTTGGEGNAVESVDGRLLYYLKPASEPSVADLWRVPVDGGSEIQVRSAIGAQYFQVIESGIFFFAKQESGPLEFYAFRTGIVKKIADIAGPVAWGLSVSPDRRSILYSKYEEPRSDLWMVENFR